MGSNRPPGDDSLLDEAMAKLTESLLENVQSNFGALLAGLNSTLPNPAQRAHRVSEDSASPDVSADQSNNPDELHRALKDEVLSLTTQVSNECTADQPFRTNFKYNHNWCCFHNRYGDGATRCRPPCSFESEN